MTNTIDMTSNVSNSNNNITQYFNKPSASTQVLVEDENMYLTEDDIKNIVKTTVEEIWQEKLHELKVLIDCCINERLDHSARRETYTRVPKQSTPTYAQFGMENYSYLLMPYLSNICKSTGDFHGILQKIIQDLYFNLDYKKNNIVYIPPNSYKSITVFKDNSWKNYELAPTLEKIVRRGNDVLQHYIIGTDPTEENEFRSEIGRKKFDALVEFTDKIDNLENYPEFRERLLKETEHTIVTNQHLVHRHIYEPPPQEETS